MDTIPEIKGLHNKPYILSINGDTKLQYPRFSPQGIERIVEYLNSKKQLNIKITVKLTKDNEMSSLKDAVLTEFLKLKNDQLAGIVVTLSRENIELEGSEEYFHNYPIIIGKKDGYTLVLVLFDDQASTFHNRTLTLQLAQSIKSIEIKRIAHDLQKSGIGCGFFAISTLKRCLTNDKFKKEIFEHPAKLEISRKFAQGSLNKEWWQECYVVEINGKNMNLADFYRAHRWAEIINPDHFKDASIADNTKHVFKIIHAKRMAAKPKKEVAATSAAAAQKSTNQETQTTLS